VIRAPAMYHKSTISRFGGGKPEVERPGRQTISIL